MVLKTFTLKELMGQWYPVPEATGYIYVMRDLKSGWLKVGRSVDPHRRRERLEKELGIELDLLDYFYTDDCVIAELMAHRMLRPFHLHGEWFYVTYEIPWKRIDRIGKLVRILDPGNLLDLEEEDTVWFD